MRVRVRRLAVATAVAAAAALAVPTAGSGLPGPARPGGPAGSSGAGPVSPAGLSAAVRTGGPRWLTLITGDRVLVRPDRHGGGPMTVLPGPGRRGIAFRQYRLGPDTMVVPADAARLVASGQVDQRLFAVNRLLADGYDDRSRSDLPLIVSYAGAAGGRAGTRARLGSAGAGAARELASVGAVAVRQDKRSAGKLWDSLRGGRPAAGKASGLPTGIARVWLDAKVRPTLDVSVPQIGAPDAWRAGFTGRGATVAVLDTGIDATHPDLADAVAGEKDFTASPSGTGDVAGHGTHVASIITGNGAASAGRRVGVAPDARLLIGKVLGDSGFGFESDVIAGMEWAAAEHADVVNMSLGTGPTDGVDPVEEAVNRLTAETGTLFVVASGNDGGAVGSPATADAALAVGAVDTDDALAEFSSRGVDGEAAAIKPEITAPGVGIVAARSADSGLEPVDGGYTRQSGTSMATPHVAGAAAILAAQHPDWTPAELISTLTGSAKPGGTVFEQGAGRVDVAAAVAQTVHTEQATVSHGVARWPHADDTPVTSTVNYVNTGSTPVTLDLAVDLRDPAGNPAAAGLAAVHPARITVPAGGRTPVTLTTDTAKPGPDGRYGGPLTATGAGQVVRTPVGLVKEVESYDLTLSFIDRNGAATPEYGFTFFDTAAPTFTAYGSYDPSGTAVVRVPKGRYFLDVFVQTLNPADPVSRFQTADAFEPGIVVDSNQSLRFDARDARSPGVRVDRPGAAEAAAIIAHRDNVAAFGGAWSYIIGFDFKHELLLPSRTATRHGEFQLVIGALLARPDGTPPPHGPGEGFTNSPYYYNVHWTAADRVPSRLVRPVQTADLAVVQTRIPAPAPGKTGLIAGLVTVALPARLTVYYTAGFPIGTQLLQLDANGEPEAELDSGIPAYHRGEHRTESWGAAVAGPAFADLDFFVGFPSGSPSMGRSENTIFVFTDQMFSDAEPTHRGSSTMDSGSIRLLRDGVQVGRFNDPFGAGFQVPPEPATYRIETTVSRSGVSEFSTRVDAAWTFRSARPVSADPSLGEALPLMAVRFAPGTDLDNAAPAGRRFAVPLYAQWQRGAGSAAMRSVTVDVSYDDGRTWRAAPLTGAGDRRVAILDHPARDGFVSLRAHATDSAGSQVEETIIRAYRIRTRGA